MPDAKDARCHSAASFRLSQPTAEIVRKIFNKISTSALVCKHPLPFFTASMYFNSSPATGNGSVQEPRPVRLRAACNPCHNAKVSLASSPSGMTNAEFHLMVRFDAAGSEMAAPAVGTSTTSTLASTTFPGSAGLQPGPKEPDLRKEQNLRTECRDRIRPGFPLGSQE